MKLENKLIFGFLIIFNFTACHSIPIFTQNFDNYPFVLPSGKVLVVVAHQDDEVFILSRIKRHLELGDKVYIVWTAASYQSGDEYLTQRISESKLFLESNSIPESHTYFLMFPDTKTHLYVDSIYLSLETIVDEIKPSVIYVSAFEGGNIDHDIANFTISKVIEESKINTVLYEFPEYSEYSTCFLLPFQMRSFPDSLETFIKPLSEYEYNVIYSNWNLYRSQYFPLHYYIWFASGNKKTFGYEYIRKKPKYNYLTEFSYGTAYESYLSVEFKDFQNAVISLENFLQKRR